MRQVKMRIIIERENEDYKEEVYCKYYANIEEEQRFSIKVIKFSSNKNKEWN